jgi:hypothetical protein
MNGLITSRRLLCCKSATHNSGTQISVIADISDLLQPQRLSSNLLPHQIHPRLRCCCRLGTTTHSLAPLLGTALLARHRRLPPLHRRCPCKTGHGCCFFPRNNPKTPFPPGRREKYTTTNTTQHNTKRKLPRLMAVKKKGTIIFIIFHSPNRIFSAIHFVCSLTTKLRGAKKKTCNAERN